MHYCTFHSQIALICERLHPVDGVTVLDGVFQPSHTIGHVKGHNLSIDRGYFSSLIASFISSNVREKIRDFK